MARLLASHTDISTLSPPPSPAPPFAPPTPLYPQQFETNWVSFLAYAGFAVAAALGTVLVCTLACALNRMLARQRAEAERNGASSIDDDPLSADSYGPYFAAAAARRARLAALAGAAHIDGSGLWHAPSLELVVKEGVLVLQPDESDTRGLTCVGLACTSSKLSGFEQQETGTAGDKGAHETAVSAEPQPESGQQAEGQMPQQPQDGRGTGAVLHEASSPSRTGDGTSASTGGPAAEQPTLNTAQTNSSGADNCKEQSDKGQS